MGFSAYSIEKKQVSTDRGVTWQDVDPSETRQGQLLGVYRTLTQCEDRDCPLEEYRYELVDTEMVDTYCGERLPYGFAKRATFTSGTLICGVQPNNTHGCKITTDSSHAIQYNKFLHENEKGYVIDISTVSSRRKDDTPQGTCTAWVNYKTIDLYGDSLEGLTEPNCCSCCNETTCFHVDEYMPWVGSRVKKIKKRHYTRERCKGEWVIDQEYGEIDMGFGERWVPVEFGEAPLGRYWQHQLAVMTDDDTVLWENVGSMIEYTDGYIIDDYGFTFLNELYNDGQYYIDMSELGGSSVEYSFRVSLNPSGYAISTSSNSRQVTSGDAETRIGGTINGNNCKIFSDNNGGNISTDVFCTSIYSQCVSDTFNGWKAFIPAKIKDTDVKGLVSTEFDIFLPLSNYQVRWVESEDYYCKNFAKYKLLELQYSSDGENWSPTEATKVGDMITDLSSDCGFSNYKVFIDTNENYDRYLIQCDGSDEVTASEIPSLDVGKTYSVRVGSCVNELGDAVLASKGVTSISFSGDILYYDDECLRDNGELSSTIPLKGTYTIGNNAFRGCEKAKFEYSGNNLTSIGERAFYLCHEINEYRIPDTVTSVGAEAFALTYVDSQSLDVMNTPRPCYIGTGITEIPEYCFFMAAQIHSVEIPSSVTRIEEAAFSSCYRITSLTLHEGLEYIGTSAFRNLYYVYEYYVNKWGDAIPRYTGLTSVDIPSTVTEIGDYAFADCGGMSTINMYSIHPPTLGSNAFVKEWKVSVWSGLTYITIPQEADLEEWQTADGWSEYADRIRKRE